MKKKHKDTIAGLLFASPWIIGFLIFTLYPIIISLYYGFTDFSIFKPPIFVGLDNYKALFKDELFIKSLNNTLYMTAFATPINLLFGLGTAMLLNMKIKGMSFYRTIFYIPSIVPQVAATILWVWILNARYGLLNNILKIFGIYQPNWFQDPNYTKPALIIMGMWATGTIMIIFLAALQDIPRSFYESADIDGANNWNKFIKITLPTLSPVILYQLIVSIIFNFQIFTQAWVIGEAGGGGNAGLFGGPENSILFYATYIFYNAFSYFKMGKASAMAWILFIITAFITWLVFKTSNKWVTYGGE
ncbi:MAG TPA: sugar ABC transporter permease [Clostridiaceae bacterium]